MIQLGLRSGVNTLRAGMRRAQDISCFPEIASLSLVPKYLLVPFLAGAVARAGSRSDGEYHLKTNVCRR